MDKLYDFVLDNFKGKRKDRALRFLSGQLKHGDPELKKYLSCEAARARRAVMGSYKMIELCEDHKREYQEVFNQYKAISNVVDAAELHLILAQLDEDIESEKKQIAFCGRHLSNILQNDVLTEHEACQLFNINEKTWEECRQRYYDLMKDKRKPAHPVYSIITVAGAEYRERKGRAKGFYDCPEYEMPVYWAIHEHIYSEMKGNKELNAAAFQKFKELWPEIKTYRAIKDMEGNIISTEEDE